jgi:pimeloyl-ACP methyl ester carboxylesterase
MANVELREVTIDGVRTVVRTAGPNDAREAVVFVHGNPGSGEDWSDLLERVGEHARAIAPDMPGFGRSDRPEHFTYTVQGYGRRLGALIEALAIERVHLVLHDFGCPWGLSWASEHPGAVASVTLINMGALPGYRWHKYARIWRTPLLGEAFMATTFPALVRRMLDLENPKPFPREFTDRVSRDLDRGMKRAVLRLYRATPDLGALTCDLAEKLASRRLPALVVWGTEDAFLPSLYAHEQGRYFAVSAVHLLEGCGHFPFVDDPERVAALIVPFLRSQLDAQDRTSQPSRRNESA